MHDGIVNTTDSTTVITTAAIRSPPAIVTTRGITNPFAADPTPVASPNSFNWYKDDAATMRTINGPIYRRDWQVLAKSGETWTEGCNNDEQISRLDVFLQMFPLQNYN